MSVGTARIEHDERTLRMWLVKDGHRTEIPEPIAMEMWAQRAMQRRGMEHTTAAIQRAASAPGVWWEARSPDDCRRLFAQGITSAWDIENFSPELRRLRIEQERAEQLASSLAIGTDDARRLVTVCTSDSAIRMAVIAAFGAHQGLDSAYALLEGAKL